MELTELIPFARIEETLDRPLQIERLSTRDWRRLLKRDPEATFGIAASAWHRLVETSSLTIDPMMMRQYFERSDPRLAGAIEGIVGQPLVKELGFVEAVVEHSGKPFVVGTSCVVHLYSDELHLYDIALADPRHPLSKKKRKSESQRYRGFGLLGTVMGNVFSAAAERRSSVVTLTAAHRPLVSVFSRYGFAVEQSELAERALEWGVGIPMVWTPFTSP